jgi:hypothetical protein
MPCTSFSSTKRMARTTSSSWTNWKRGSNPNMLGTSGSWRALARGVVMSGPSTLENRSIDTMTWGLSTAKSRT